MRTAVACGFLVALVALGSPAVRAQCGLLDSNGACLGVVTLPVPSDGAEVRCGLFDTTQACQGRATRRFRIELTPERKQNGPLSAPDLWAVVRAHELPMVSGAIDCEMVRWADPSIDPQIVKHPPAGVAFTLRVIEVPSCRPPNGAR